jgi:dipeptidyl-peptidase-4
MRSFIVLFVAVFVSTGMQAQSAQITLEDLWLNYRYYPSFIDDLRSMNDGEHYTVKEGNAIVQYAYATGEVTDTIFDATGMEDVDGFDGYAFNDDETALMLSTNTTPRYRYATFQDNYVVSLSDGAVSKLTETGMQMYADFAPAGNKVAYVIENNLYFTDLNSGEETVVTVDGELNSIINGGSDWVYEEEFALVRSFEWSPDGKKIAYYRFDESAVPEFTMPYYRGGLYPEQYTFKYPKVGEANSLVSIWIYDLETRSKTVAKTGDVEYIPRIKWIDTAHLCITTLNRLQNELTLLNVNATDGNASVLFEETAEHYVEINDDLTFLADGSGFIWRSEMDGYSHLYHIGMDGKVVKQVTTGNWDVIEFLGYEPNNGALYYVSSEDSPMERQLYAVRLDGYKKRKITKGEGTHNIDFSEGFKYYIDYFSTLSSPYYITLHKGNGEEIRVLEDNISLRERMSELAMAEPEFFSFETSEGVSLNGYMIKPADFDASKKYPVFMYVYGGPGSQTVQDSYGGFNYFWFQMLAQQGYIVVSVDNRGTGARGRDFRTVTYENLGKYETIDQIEAAKWLGKQSYVDASRIGIFGWSYGGYMTALCLTKGADVFKAGVSVAPVSNWKYYDNIYTERYMGTPETNPDGFDANSPTTYTDQLRDGSLLLVHGTGDDNVHWQNSAELINALVRSNKQFDLMVYPDRNHGIYGGNTRYHLYKKMTTFIKENL